MKTTAAEISNIVSFEYDVKGLDSIGIKQGKDEQTGRTWIDTISIGDQEFPASPRFLTSLYARFGFNERFFAFFSPEEVLARIMTVRKDDRIRLCIANFDNGERRLLATSNPANGVAHADKVVKLFEAFGSEGLVYHDGVMVSTHTPRVAPVFDIAGDDYTNKFTMSVPIDGYGSPFATLALHRISTKATMVAHCKTFRSDLKLGKGGDDLESSLGRALDSFNNDEGYAAARERLESAATSWTSVNEAESYRSLLQRHIGYGIAKYNPEAPGLSSGKSVVHACLGMLQHINGIDPEARGNALLQAYHKLTGNIQEQLGFANLESLSEKRRRSLPVKCRVLDLLNMASEVASHHSVSGQNDINQWIGSILSNEYDIEGSMAAFGDFDQFWSERKFGRAVSEEAAAN